MKTIIGGIILAMVLAFLIVATCIAYGWKVGLIVWAMPLILEILIVIAIELIAEDE